MSYPINLDVEGKICVVVGGGRVAHRKVLGLIEAKAKVVLIAPVLCDELRALVEPQKIIWLEQNYEYGCLPRGVLMIAATNRPSVNRLAAREAIEKKMLVNVVDGSSTHGVNFENPATIRRGKFLLTISTGGASPALSKFMRIGLERIFDEDFGRRLEVIESLRSTVKEIIKDPEVRIEFWRQVMNEKIFSPMGNSEELEANIRDALDSYRAQSQDGAD